MILQFFEEMKAFSDSVNLSGEVRPPKKIAGRIKAKRLPSLQTESEVGYFSQLIRRPRKARITANR
jgi:hypothetical protein